MGSAPTSPTVRRRRHVPPSTQALLVVLFCTAVTLVSGAPASPTLARSLAAEGMRALNFDIARNLRTAAGGRPFAVISRSDLRALM
jgi:hypothetical protein